MNTPTPAQLIRIEAEALLRLAARLEDGMSASFSEALELVVECGQAARAGRRDRNRQERHHRAEAGGHL